HAVDSEPEQSIDCALVVHRPDMHLEAEPMGGRERLTADELDVAKALWDLERASLGRIPLEAVAERALEEVPHVAERGAGRHPRCVRANPSHDLVVFGREQTALERALTREQRDDRGLDRRLGLLDLDV